MGKMADVEETSSYYNNRGLSFFEEVLQGNRKLHQRVGVTINKQVIWQKWH